MSLIGQVEDANHGIFPETRHSGSGQIQGLLAFFGVSEHAIDTGNGGMDFLTGVGREDLMVVVVLCHAEIEGRAPEVGYVGRSGTRVSVCGAGAI